MRLLLILLSLSLLSCSEQSSLKGSIISKYGASLEESENDRYYLILYRPETFDDFYHISKGVKGHIDKEINMIPTVEKEGQNLELILYDHYEWEKPGYKVTLINSIFNMDSNDYRVKIIIENK